MKSGKKNVGLPRSYNNLSAVSIKTGDYTGAIQQCLKGLRYKPDDYLKLLFFQNLADSYAALGNKGKATHYYLAAIDLLGTGQVNPTKSISLYKSYADFLFGIENFERSKVYYDSALAMSLLYSRSGSEVYASLLSKIGNYYGQFKHDEDSALMFYNKSIGVWKNILVTKGAGQNKSFDDIRFLDAYLGKAQVLASQYKEVHRLDLLKESYDLYKWALDKAGEISGYLDSETQLILNEKFRKAYEEVVDITYLMYQETSDSQYKEMAFEFAERIKSSVLLAAVQNINALKTTDVPEHVIQSEQQLQQEVNGMKKLLVDEQMKARPSKKRLDFINSRLLQLMIDYDSMVSRIEHEYPRYFALKYDRSVIRIDELTKQLQEDEVLIEYVLSDSMLTMFCMGGDVNYFSQFKIDSVFNESLNRLINLKSVDLAQHSKADMLEFIHDAHLLWTYLLEPVYGQLSGKRLIIVPDGLLGYLSFDLLLNSPAVPEELDYKQLPYLFKEFPISYSYSSSLRFNPYFKRGEVYRHELIAFAPENKQLGTGKSELSLLPNSGNEVKEVSAVFGGNAYLENEATKTRFLKEALDYRIIHLAMHTLINDSLPMLSELIFYEDGNSPSDGKLFTYEVFGLKLAAELVVLSACNTGTGRLQKGEGIMSLARGFKYAGVPSLILTLWEVQDKATSEIMKQFYLYLKAGKSKDVALQKAKIDFLAGANRLKSHPYYWSSFLISGDTEQIVDKDAGSKTSRLIYFGIMLVLMLVVGFVLKIKERKKT
ncbi:MAG: CHAT domain-containing protein [Bacteroidales bacterium]|nr:CHAT domain-containing protein [Bacteroidales bacterium]